MLTTTCIACSSRQACASVHRLLLLMVMTLTVMIGIIRVELLTQLARKRDELKCRGVLEVWHKLLSSDRAIAWRRAVCSIERSHSNFRPKYWGPALLGVGGNGHVGMADMHSQKPMPGISGKRSLSSCTVALSSLCDHPVGLSFDLPEKSRGTPQPRRMSSEFCKHTANHHHGGWVGWVGGWGGNHGHALCCVH